MTRVFRGYAATALLLMMTGCATVPMGTPSPTLEGLQAIRGATYLALAVGDFQVDPTADPSIDRSVNARSVRLVPPESDSFSRHLRACFRKQLEAAGKYSAASATAIDGWLTANELHAAGTSTGNGRVAARIRVVRDGRVLLEKPFEGRAEWPATFNGFEAIPAAMTEYTTLYRKLVEQVLADPEIVRAASP